MAHNVPEVLFAFHLFKYFNFIFHFSLFHLVKLFY